MNQFQIIKKMNKNLNPNENENGKDKMKLHNRNAEFQKESMHKKL
jgi:hypothetical protein